MMSSFNAYQTQCWISPYPQRHQGILEEILPHDDLTTKCVDDVGFAWVGVEAAGDVEASARLARVKEER